MIKKIMLDPCPILREDAAEVKKFDKNIQAIARDLLDTVKKVDGLGLAAPQIGISRRIFVTLAGDLRLVYINPIIVSVNPLILGDWESCLSIPNIMGWVLRYKEITVKACNALGAPFTIALADSQARIAQHEIDHLDGVLFKDRLQPHERLFFVQ